MSQFKVIAFIFALTITGGVSAQAQTQLPLGTYKSVSELCSDGTVYIGDSDVVTSTRTDVGATIEVLDGNVLKMTSFFESRPELTGSYSAKYELSGNILKYGEVLETQFAKGSPMTKESLTQMIKQGPTIQVSTNDAQLIVSYPGFTGYDRCKSPAFVINIFEKQ